MKPMGTPITPTKFATWDDFVAWGDEMWDAMDFVDLMSPDTSMCDYFAKALFEARTELHDGRRLDTIEAAQGFVIEVWPKLEPEPEPPPPKARRRQNNLPRWWDYQTALADADFGPLDTYEQWLAHHEIGGPATECDVPLLEDGTPVITRDQGLHWLAGNFFASSNGEYHTEDGRVFRSVDEIAQWLSDEHFHPETPETLARQGRVSLRGSTEPRWIAVEEMAQRRWAPWSTEETMDDATVVHSLDEARAWADETLKPDEAPYCLIDPRAGTYGPHGTYDRAKWKTPADA